MTGRPDLRLGISDVAPVVSCGSFSTRAVVGEHLPITATVFREGHDAVAATVAFTPPAGAGGQTVVPQSVRMTKFGPEPDRWTATVVPDREGLWTYQVEAWDDPLSTWHHDIEVKVEAGQGSDELANDLESGARLLEEVAAAAPEEHRDALEAAAAALREDSLPLTARIAPALSPALQRVLAAHPVRRLVTGSPVYELWVDRPRALYGSWYEFFPRSEGPVIGG
ncbi:MAG: glgE, partial [Modestobacter sp.]|nr:glgE [Modestobacter sp.]